jgi:ectoine hydroxylase-related dioxygenase (phytanoyl-CoA dioxygenase family)
MTLTQPEIQLFRHNGFIKLPTRLPEERVEALKAAVLKDMREEVEPVGRHDGCVIRLSDLWSRGGIFRETIVCDEILDPLESLLGPNIEFVRNRHNHVYLRSKDSPASLEMHRDIAHWSRTLVTVLLYLEETTIENGCTHFIPGSHLLYPYLDREDLSETKLLSQSIPLPMPAGGMITIDSFIFHCAGKNRTDGTRMNLTLGYHSVDGLAGSDDPKRVLVRGERIYGGNDQYQNGDKPV